MARPYADLEYYHEPVLTSKEMFEEYIGQSFHGNDVYSTTETFSITENKTKAFKLNVLALSYYDCIVIGKTTFHVPTNFVTHFDYWCEIIRRDYESISLPNEKRLYETEDVISVLLGVYTQVPYVRETKIKKLSPSQVKLLIEKKNGKKWVSFEDQVYVNLFCDHGKRETVIDIIARELVRPLMRYCLEFPTVSNKSFDYLDVDGEVFEYVCREEDLYFGFSGNLGRGRLEPTTTSFRNYYLNVVPTFEEARVLIAHCENRSELEDQFTFIHPKLIGVPFGDLFVGDEVQIAIRNPKDPRSVLNGQKAIVKHVSEVEATVEILGYFKEKFLRLDLIRLNS